jgi:DnaJ-domain-containing protein 1
MSTAALEGLDAVQLINETLQRPHSDLEDARKRADQLNTLALHLAQEQRRRYSGSAHSNRASSTGQESSRQSSDSGDRDGDGRLGDSKGHYTLLGVKSSASVEEIRKAYRSKIQQYHPDLFERIDHEWVQDQAEEMTKKLNEAWDILGDPDKRRDYDRS